MLPPGYVYIQGIPPESAITNYPVTFMGIDRPSKALRAMIKGLKEASERPTFTIDMNTFGTYFKSEDLCFGCAATCALMELSGDPRLVKTVYHQRYGTPGSVLDDNHPGALHFESAIDSLRRGLPLSLFKFFRLEPYAIRSNDLCTLTSDSWDADISEYEKLADVWEANGV